MTRYLWRENEGSSADDELFKLIACFF